MTREQKRVLIAESLALDPWWKCKNHSQVDGPECSWCSGPVWLEGDNGPIGEYFTDANAALTLCDAARSDGWSCVCETTGWKVSFFRRVNGIANGEQHIVTAERISVAISECYGIAIGLWKPESGTLPVDQAPERS